nr:MAG TPA: hypothetical protein [Caudoviricetes sp.]
MVLSTMVKSFKYVSPGRTKIYRVHSTIRH